MSLLTLHPSPLQPERDVLAFFTSQVSSVMLLLIASARIIFLSSKPLV